MRSKTYLLTVREKHIKRRLKLAKALWTGDDILCPGRFNKYNLVCSCPLCRDPKYRDNRSKEKYRGQDDGQEEETQRWL